MKKPFYKRWWFITIVVFVILAAIFGETEEETADEADTQAVASNEKKEENPKEEQKENEEEKAKREAAEKEQKEKEAAEKLVKEKEYYINDLQSLVDTQMKYFDDDWSRLWTTTFEQIGTTMDVYTAYANMKELNNLYTNQYNVINNLKAEGLSKENGKLFDEFKEGMKGALLMRTSAAEKAMELFDEGDYSPSNLDKLKTDIEAGDTQMMLGLVSLVSLETNLGVERPE